MAPRATLGAVTKPKAATLGSDPEHNFAHPPFKERTPMHKTCERCGQGFEIDGPTGAVRAWRAKVRRFCSELCRKRAERARYNANLKGTA